MVNWVPRFVRGVGGSIPHCRAMPLCIKCKKDVPLEIWHKSYCKPCKKIWDKEHPRSTESNRSSRHKRRKIVRQYVYDYLKSHPCPCGESQPECLDFDHIDPLNKREKVSELIRNCSLNVVKAEIEKCNVLCANCHRKRTAKQFGWYLDLI
jgi:hypothetical protein